MDAPHAAAHVAGAPEAPGEKPAGTSFERWALVVIVLAMVLLPTLEAAVRRVTGSGVPGAAVYTQHLTLWVGFLGAMLATSTGNHLALSTVDFLRAGWPRELARAFDSAVTTLVCALLAYASFDMVLLDKGRVDTLAGGVPEWWFEVVMPLGFAVMSIRGAMKAPSRGAKAVCWILIAAVLPFLVSRALAVRGEGFLTMPDGPTLLRGHTSALGWPGSLVLFAAFLLGAPVFVVMAGYALLLFYLAGTPVASVPAETFRLVVSPTLPAIPLLTVAGYVLAEGGASRRLVRAAQGWFGWMPGGLAVMATFVCALFTTFTGASGVTILALGGIILPALVSEKYPEGFSLGLVTAAGSLGLLFPPSLPVILYGVVAGVQQVADFLARLYEARVSAR